MWFRRLIVSHKQFHQESCTCEYHPADWHRIKGSSEEYTISHEWNDYSQVSEWHQMRWLLQAHWSEYHILSNQSEKNQCRKKEKELEVNFLIHYLQGVNVDQQAAHKHVRHVRIVQVDCTLDLPRYIVDHYHSHGVAGSSQQHQQVQKSIFFLVFDLTEQECWLNNEQDSDEGGEYKS